ncbi:MFS transporter [Alteromonas oceani]|uniref:MFS transporter n=1 Tax=Alteromonas oceani TaxID=2071609 RepID=A0ABV7JYT3_9ALTE|nr:MFS transporter [Alteromonas oceani]
MRMAITFGSNQIISLGFGLFLFAAMVPMMQQDIAISHWYLATIGAATQLAYLGGAMLLGLFGHKLNSARLLLWCGVMTSLLLFAMAIIQSPLAMLIVLVLMAASAAVSWGGIVELVSCFGQPQYRATSLSTAASGTAWGYSINGLIILAIVPLAGWQGGWVAAAIMGLVTVGATAFMLRRLCCVASQVEIEAPPSMPAKQLFRTIFKERIAFVCSLMTFLVGFATMPFSTWLNTYLAELSLPAELGGYTWSLIGLSGMAAGFLVGKLADSKGSSMALLFTTSVFAIGIIAFLLDPATFVLLAGFSYGLMYFPIWGVLAGWLSKHYGSKATMQINGIGMVTFGLGGALGNMIAGGLYEASGSLADLFALIAFTSVLLTLLALYIFRLERQVSRPVIGAV